MLANRRSKLPVCVAAAFLGFGLMLFGNFEVTEFTATPLTLSFSSANPDGTSTKQATLRYKISDGQDNRPWNVTVHAANPTFTNCSFLPASAVRVACASVSATDGATGSCSSQFNLSSAPGTVASGLLDNDDPYFTVVINYTLVDAWKYQGKISPSCSLTLNYTVTAYP